MDISSVYFRTETTTATVELLFEKRCCEFKPHNSEVVFSGKLWVKFNNEALKKTVNTNDVFLNNYNKAVVYDLVPLEQLANSVAEYLSKDLVKVVSLEKDTTDEFYNIKISTPVENEVYIKNLMHFDTLDKIDDWDFNPNRAVFETTLSMGYYE